MPRGVRSRARAAARSIPLTWSMGRPHIGLCDRNTGMADQSEDDLARGRGVEVGGTV